jgi:6-phosphofructokinase 1
MQPHYRARAAQKLRETGIEGIVILGGEGSFKGMRLLHDEHGIAVAGIPSTIDNDIAGTEYCLGVDTALNVIKCQIDAVRDTAASFSRAFVIETMGRECGYLALVSALTCGAEMGLIPELPYDLDAYAQIFKEQKAAGRRYFIAVVAEALKCTDKIAEWFEKEVGMESRTVVLGHTQRGGNPTVYDRIMAYRFVTHAVDALCEGKSGVVCLEGTEMRYKTVEDVAFKPYRISEELLALWERGRAENEK